jgi:hypothetical protein
VLLNAAKYQKQVKIRQLLTLLKLMSRKSNMYVTVEFFESTNDGKS